MIPLVSQEQEAVSAGLVVVGGELRKVDEGARTGGEVEEATTCTISVVGEHGPLTGSKAATKGSAHTRVSCDFPPHLAHGSEADVLGHIILEQSIGDLVDQHRRQIEPIPHVIWKWKTRSYQKLRNWLGYID